MNNTNMYQLLITATNKEHSNLKTFGYGLNYPIPIVNPVWVGMDKIIAAQASGKLDIMIHNVDPPVLLTHELFAKFTELGYVDEEVVAETPHSEEEGEGTHEGNPEDNSHTEEAHETHEEENHVTGGISESEVVPPTPTVPATETETAPAAPEPEVEAPASVDFRAKYVAADSYKASKKLFENTPAMEYAASEKDVTILVQITDLKDTNGNITEDKIKVLAGNPTSADGLRFPVELSMQNDKPFFSKNGKGMITYIAAYKVTDSIRINTIGLAVQVNGEQVAYVAIDKHMEYDHL